MPTSPPEITETGADPLLAGARLTVDLGALVDNYRELRHRSGAARTAAVVKADAYGLGAAQVAPSLVGAGCETFFVAQIEEGIALRRVVDEADIFVIAGMNATQAAFACAEARLTPVLNTPGEIEVWATFWQQRGSRRPCAIHVDTGMNRLGLSASEAIAFAEDNATSHAVTPILLMSHLACADEPDHPLNQQQLQQFQSVRGKFSELDSSLSNSAGVFLGTDYHFELTRPGISLYGGAPLIGDDNPMQPVITVEARILQIRNAKAGETVSYGATETLSRDSRIAVVSAGYADGYHRAASGSGVALREALPAGAVGSIAGHRAPVLGRVTMDLTMFDITDLPPDAANVGDWVELIGPNATLGSTASAAGTVSYEMLTSLGQRFQRRYVQDM